VRTLGANVIRSLVILIMIGPALRAQESPEKRGQLLPEDVTDNEADRSTQQTLDQSRRDLNLSVRNSEDFSESRLGISFLKNIALDQKAIWTSPARLHWADGTWLFPLVSVTTLSVATDRSFVHALSNDPHKLNRYRNFSNDGVAALVGAGAGFYLWSHISHDDQQREAGIVSAEAVIDSILVTQGLKYTFGRERPTQDQGGMRFFKGGNSFPSDHAAVAWSAANVIAHEYPGFITKTLAYGLATAVSVSAALGKDHSPSDVLVGSAIGWLIGRQVYRAHHNPDLGGTVFGALPGASDDDRERDPHKMGSPFVPLDSWVYPAFERLAALGYIQTAIMGLKPWTRIECARLADEAAEKLEQGGALNQEATQLQARLRQEFSYEFGLLDGSRNLTAKVESIYTRAVSISGPALNDGYHFGQTIAYDFGRPFERGMNGQVGGSFSASAGPLTMYVRAEYQHAPAAPGPSDAVRTVIAQADLASLSQVPAGPLSTVNQPELLDAYAAVNIHNFQLVAGRQSLSWAPGPDSMMWSNNIQPVNMVRLVNAEPYSLPSFLRYLGPVRIDQFFGRLEGHPYVPRPFVYGQKINVKPFPFLELGFGRRSMIGGTGGDPLTTGNLVRSFFGVINPRLNSVPGDNESEMDWTFYVPKVRNYIVLYGDAYAEDDILPVENPPRNPWHPGIYITRIPGIPKLDFHMEGVSTESPCGIIGAGNHRCGGNRGIFNYYNGGYPDGNTSNGNLIGNTVGREGRAIHFWLTYWLSQRNTLQFIYGHNTVSPDFMPQGGAWQDYAFKNETYLQNGFYMKAEVQYENISRYPILFDGRRRNVTAILELGFYPEKKSRKQKNDP
jgi:membrane-associated phospholipid phosphatase